MKLSNKENIVMKDLLEGILVEVIFNLFSFLVVKSEKFLRFDGACKEDRFLYFLCLMVQGVENVSAVIYKLSDDRYKAAVN